MPEFNSFRITGDKFPSRTVKSSPVLSQHFGNTIHLSHVNGSFLASRFHALRYRHRHLNKICITFIFIQIKPSKLRGRFSSNSYQHCSTLFNTICSHLVYIPDDIRIKTKLLQYLISLSTSSPRYTATHTTLWDG